MCLRGTVCSELDGVPEVCSQLLWTLCQPHTGSKIWLLPASQVMVASLEMKQKMSASFSVAPAASASSRALADEDQPTALFYANGLHLSFPVFKFMLVCCQHSAVRIVTRLQLNRRTVSRF